MGPLHVTSKGLKCFHGADLFVWLRSLFIEKSLYYGKNQLFFPWLTSYSMIPFSYRFVGSLCIIIVLTFCILYVVKMFIQSFFFWLGLWYFYICTYTVHEVLVIFLHRELNLLVIGILGCFIIYDFLYMHHDIVYKDIICNNKRVIC